MLADERLHQLLALGVLQVDDVDTSRAERFFAADERVVLAPTGRNGVCQQCWTTTWHGRRDSHDHPRHFVQNACPGAHVAGTERGVHGRAFVDFGWLAAERFESRHFGLRHGQSPPSVDW